MSSGKARPIAFEFVTIFAAVFLGLLADAWREGRVRRAEAREALAILSEDLLADSIGIESLRAPLERHVSAAAWFQENWQRSSVSMDSVGLNLRTLMFFNYPTFRRAAYTSLLDGDRLALIRNDSLRLAVVQYFEVSQDRVQFWTEGHANHRLTRTIEVLTPHARLPRGRDATSVWPPVEGPLDVTSSWSEFRADNAVYNDVVGLAWWADAALRAVDVAQARNAELREAIARELDSV